MADTGREMQRVMGSLRGLRARARAALVAQRVLLVVAAAGAVALAGGVLDYALRTPTWLRVGLLAVVTGALAAALRGYVWPALRFCPSLTDVALRVERANPGLSGLLASAVEFAQGKGERSGVGPIGATERGLRGAVVERAARSFGGVGGMLSLRRLWGAVLRCGAMGLVAAGVFAASPELARIGAARIMTPWSGAEWPKRTGVVDVTFVEAHPRGVALPLRAAVTRSPRPMDETSVTAQHRTVSEGGRVGPTRSMLLTHQRRAAALLESGEGETGALFERLVDVDGAFVEYRFVTADDATAWARVRVVDPPAVEEARAVITPPAYAAGGGEAGEAGGLTRTAEVELGDGTDERASAPPALAGSVVELTLRLNKPIPGPPAEDESGAEELQSWVERTFGGEAGLLGMEVASSGQEWRARWRLEESVRLSLSLVDEHGIGSTEETSFRFEAVADRAPSAVVSEPAADGTALATATVRVAGEGRDDVGLRFVSLERAVTRPEGRTPSGPGGALAQDGEAAEVARVEAGGARSASAEATLELAGLSLQPGDEVWVTAVAGDALATETGPRTTRSAVRRVRIISEAQLIEEIRAELGSVRQSAIRVDQQQGDLQRQVSARGSDRRARAGQAQVGERLGRQAGALESLEERARVNNLRDETLERLVREAREATASAERASDEAAESLDRAAARAREAGQEGEGPTPLEEGEAKETSEAQQRVRDALARLIEALDAGQDSWVARRQIEDLLRQQRELRERTGRQGAETAGLSADELTPPQRSELERIVEAQRDLAQKAQEVAEGLPERAEQVRARDPGAAAGLQSAARRAEQSRVGETMQRAAEQAGQNQTAEAQRQQEQAERDLEGVLEELDRGERARQEQLRRQLASLLASLDALIEMQERELARLGEAEAAGGGAGLGALAEGMIRLNRNTLGVVSQASGRELAPVAALITRAGDAQGRAIASLRGEPPSAAGAREGEEESLARLREAKAEAERVDAEQSREEETRKRAALRRAYVEALERQVAARNSAGTLALLPAPTRRDRASVRAVGEEQGLIRAGLARTLSETEEVAAAKVFEYAHARMDAESLRAEESLGAGEAAPALPHQDRVIAQLRSLIEALEDLQRQREEEFAQQAAGQQGGSGGSPQPTPLLPPYAELKLLRDMQQMVALETRALGEAERAPGEEVSRVGKQQRELVDLAKDLAARAAEQAGGAMPPVRPAPVEPAPEEGPREGPREGGEER